MAVAGAADVAVLKCAPLGGVRRALRVAEAAGLPCVVSSALETSVGMAAELALAGALPALDLACGLASGALLAADVVPQPLQPVDGRLPVPRTPPTPDPALLDAYAADPDRTRVVARAVDPGGAVTPGGNPSSRDNARVASASADRRVFFVGDSYVVGIGDPERRGWVGRVAERSDRDGLPITVYNLGVRRDTSDDIARRWAAEVGARRVAGSEDRMVVAFGVNDTADEGGRRGSRRTAAWRTCGRSSRRRPRPGCPCWSSGRRPSTTARRTGASPPSTGSWTRPRRSWPSPT